MMISVNKLCYSYVFPPQCVAPITGVAFDVRLSRVAVADTAGLCRVLPIASDSSIKPMSITAPKVHWPPPLVLVVCRIRFSLPGLPSPTAMRLAYSFYDMIMPCDAIAVCCRCCCNRFHFAPLWSVSLWIFSACDAYTRYCAGFLRHPVSAARIPRDTSCRLRRRRRERVRVGRRLLSLLSFSCVGSSALRLTRRGRWLPSSRIWYGISTHFTVSFNLSS